MRRIARSRTTSVTVSLLFLLFLHSAGSLTTDRCSQETLAKAILQVWACQKSLVLSDLQSSSSPPAPTSSSATHKSSKSPHKPCSVRLAGSQLKSCLVSLSSCLQPQQLHTAEQVFGRDLIFQTGSEGCHQGGLVASEGDQGPTRDPLMLLLTMSGVATDKKCNRKELEEEERDRQSCVMRGLHQLEQETGRQWGLESPCWDSGEKNCPDTILCSRLPALATACAQDTTCLSPSEASLVAKIWLGKADLLLQLLGTKCPRSGANTRKAGSSAGQQRISLDLTIVISMLVFRLGLF